MRELFKESTIIIENARENINLHTGVFSVSRLLWKKSFVLLLSSLYCFLFNGVFGSVLPSYVDGETTNAIESYICAVLLLLKLFLLVFLERRKNTFVVLSVFVTPRRLSAISRRQVRQILVSAAFLLARTTAQK